MSLTWQTAADAPAISGPVHLDAVLTPNRSLGARAFFWLMLAFAGLNAVIAAYFIAKGAWPVLIFNAIDVALLYGAFHINFRDGRAWERVLVCAEAVHVTRQSAKGARTHFVANPLWARVVASPRAVRIQAGQGALDVGAFLSEGERRSFAAALNAAFSRARGR
jgi:uncharacterized membrane protein